MPNGMTGFGRATTAHPGGAVTVELKSVNNRFLKVSTRLPDVFTELETELEATRRVADLLKAQTDPKGGGRSSRRS